MGGRLGQCLLRLRNRFFDTLKNLCEFVDECLKEGGVGSVTFEHEGLGINVRKASAAKERFKLGADVRVTSTSALRAVECVPGFVQGP